MDERVWLKHPTTGGYFHCPADAVDGWKGMGWEASDPPPEEINPAVVEILASQQEQATNRTTKPTKAAAGGKAEKE